MKEFSNYFSRPGIIAGAILIALIFVTYIIGLEVFSSWWAGVLIGLASTAFLVVMMVRPTVRYRRDQGGFVPFADVFFIAMGVYVIATLLQATGNILLYNVINPEYASEVADFSREMALEWMADLPEDLREQQMAEMADMEDRFTTIGFLKQFLWGLIFGAIVAVIIGLSVRKKRPPHLDESFA